MTSRGKRAARGTSAEASAAPAFLKNATERPSPATSPMQVPDELAAVVDRLDHDVESAREKIVGAIQELARLSSDLQGQYRQRIQELESANAEMEQRRRDFFTLIDRIPVLFSYVDTRRRYRFVNRQYERVFGLPAAEIIGKTQRELLGEEAYAVARPYGDQVLAGESVQFTVELPLPTGLRLVQVSFVPELDQGGQVTGFFTLVNDLSERQRIEAALMENERRLRAVLAAAADAIITITADGVIESFNPAAERIFGYSAREVIGRNVAILMPNPYCEEHAEYVARYLQTRQARVIGIGREVIALRKNGSTFPADLAVSEVEDGVGPIFIGIIRDLTERKAMQQHLLSIHSEEQRRVGQELHDSLGQKLTGLGLLAGSLAESLSQSTPGEAAAARRLVDGISRALGEVRTLSQGLIPVDVDAEGLGAALSQLAEQVTANTGVRCDFQCPRQVRVENNAIATHLFRIAEEAVTNALRHGAPRNIELSLVGERGEITLCVRDDGRGISADALIGRGQGVGLRSMQYRAGLIGASFDIRPLKNMGTILTCRLYSVPIGAAGRGARASRHKKKRP